MDNHSLGLHISKSPSASVTRLGEAGWHLEIPAHNRFGYHIAQLDDHSVGPRSQFPLRPPLSFSLQGRVSAQDLPGTWGFGFWNDPFNLLMAYNRPVPRLPTLPDAAWFFNASHQSYLSFRNDLPANGFLAATFSATRVRTLWLALASPVMALALIPGAAQWVRKLLRRFVKQDAVLLPGELTDWHTYRIEWSIDQVKFLMDDLVLLQTNTAPHPPLSLVIWIDNQYAALSPKGSLKYGYLANPEPAWLEIKEIRLQELA